MTIKLGMVMDPIDLRSGSFAIMCEAYKRHNQIYFMEQHDLFIKDGKAFAEARAVNITLNPTPSYTFDDPETIPLNKLDVIFMRKDPPVDMQFIHATHILEIAENDGVLVVNKPQSLRDANEKLFASWFPQYCPPSLTTNKIALLKKFLSQQQEIVIKKLDSHASKGVFYLREHDFNNESIIQLVTNDEQNFVLAQKFLPEIFQGDKRLFLIDGELVAPYSFLRIPTKKDFRALIDGGAKTGRADITDHEMKIVQEIAPILKSKGLFFVSIDLIGSYISEINVTSVGSISTASQAFNTHIPSLLLDTIEIKIGQNNP